MSSPAADRPGWIDRLGTERNRACAACRAREPAAPQSTSVTALRGDPSVQDFWSDGLQLRLAASSEEPAVLRRPAAPPPRRPAAPPAAGRTKRVRHLASGWER